MNIILRSSWQTANIGDIAHSPSVIRVLLDHFPDANITLWASPNITDEVKDLIHSKYPDVKIVTGAIHNSESKELLEAVDKADLLIHGSAASFGARGDVKEFIERTGKPYGVFGISFEPFSQNDVGARTMVSDTDVEAQRDLLNKASFVYFRDSKSLARAREIGVKGEAVDFGCDGVFAYDIVNMEKAEATMKKYGLEKGKFVCCIPRYRYTPFWEIYSHRPYIPERDAYNKQMIENDHTPLIEAITKIVDNTDLKVFICSEDSTQVALGKTAIYDKLPERIKDRVVLKKEYWLTDEAVGVYMNSAGLFGLEMHSPIMCVGHGIPAIVARFKEQTTKGFMWEDIGLGEWLFDFDNEEDRKRFSDTCLKMVTNREESVKKALMGRANAFATYERMTAQIKKTLDA